MNLFSNIRRWDLIVMFVLIGAILVFEMIGVFSPRMVTLTQILKQFIPMPIRIMIFSWLGWHFILSDLVKQLTPVR